MMKQCTLIAVAFALTLSSGLTADNTKLKQAVVQNYANIVHASYEDSLAEGKRLQKAIDAFVAKPSKAGLENAKKVWVEARLPYLQTEVYRFYAGPIDDDDGPEGLLNAWPMDEAYVDSVKGNEKAGIVNDPKKFPKIDKALIEKLNEQGGEENISSGYHAIEFLLWGQDLSVTGPGERPYTDYTTAKNADRRKQYLKASVDLLVDHLQHLVDEWAPGKKNYRAAFEKDVKGSVKNIMTGMSMLTGFELSGERLLVAYESQAQEDEHSCFSDTTHNDCTYDIIGIVNVWNGSYKRLDGSTVSGKGIKDLALAADADLAKALDKKMNDAITQSKAIPVPFDQAILGKDDTPARKSIMVLIENLEDQASSLKKLAGKLGFDVPISE